MERKKQIRTLLALLFILLMVGAAEWTGEKEILFPEMVALTIGLLLVDKRVWNVQRWQIVIFMTLGAIAGICIVRYSPLSYLTNLCLGFAFAAFCLWISRTTLIPLISACVLPVLLHTESIIYPITVFSMSLLAVFGQKILERYGFRGQISEIQYQKQSMTTATRWLALIGFVGLISVLPFM